MYNDVEDLIPSDKNRRRAKKAALLNEIKDIEDMTPMNSSFLPSSLLKDKSKKEEKVHEERPNTGYDPEDPDEWFRTIEVICSKPSKKRIRKGTEDLFESSGIAKKKKKKKKGQNGDMIDFKREFEAERALLKNLLIDQNRFTESLQREYDNIIGKKSSNRGMTKNMTDLIETINQARSLSMQLIDKHVSIKKTAAELNMKQKKEFGGIDTENMSDFAASYMKNMLNNRAAIMGTGYQDSVGDYTEEELMDALGNIELEDRSSDVSKYLEYENRDVEIFVMIDENNPDGIANYNYVAKDKDGNIIDDYPLPSKDKISVNRSTNVATDSYGQRYRIIWI